MLRFVSGVATEFTIAITDKKDEKCSATQFVLKSRIEYSKL